MAKDLPELDEKKSPTKVFVIAAGDRPEDALKAQASWIRQVMPPHLVLFSCGTQCEKDDQLHSVVIAPNLMNNLPQSNKPQDYRQAALRWPWGIWYLWHAIASQNNFAENRGFTLPNKPFDWWIMADADTFVNLDMLDKVLQKYDPRKPYVLTKGDCGGPGIAMSRAATEVFANKFVSEFLPRINRNQEMVYHDQAMMGFFRNDPDLRAQGLQVIEPDEFTQYEPTLKDLQNGTYQKTYATWHHCWGNTKMTPEVYNRYIYGDKNKKFLREQHAKNPQPTVLFLNDLDIAFDIPDDRITGAHNHPLPLKIR